MATLYGRGRGRAGSHAPKPEKPYWLKLKPQEIEKIIIELGKKDISPAKIGLILRDSYGIPNVRIIIGKKIQKVLKEAGLYEEDESVVALEKKAKALEKHLEKNKKDTRAKRGLHLTKSKIIRLKKYSTKKSKAK